MFDQETEQQFKRALSMKERGKIEDAAMIMRDILRRYEIDPFDRDDTTPNKEENRKTVVDEACLLLQLTGNSKTYDAFTVLVEPLARALNMKDQSKQFVNATLSILPALVERDGSLAAKGIRLMAEQQFLYSSKSIDSENLRLKIAERAVAALPNILRDDDLYGTQSTIAVLLAFSGADTHDVTRAGADIGIVAASPEHPVVSVYFGEAAKPVFCVSTHKYYSAENLLRSMQGCPPDMMVHFEKVVEWTQSPRPEIDWRDAVSKRTHVVPFKEKPGQP